MLPVYRQAITVSCLWLLMLSCGEGPVVKEPDPAAGGQDLPRFTLLPADSTGIHLENLVSESIEANILYHQNHYNGGGVCIGDIDGDGLPDVFLTGSEVGDRLYRNLGGLRFEDITASAGIQHRGGWSTGCVMADVDGDGHLDIYVCKGGIVPAEQRHNELWMNNGDGTFTESAAQWGVDHDGHATMAAFFDMDGDGDLDLFVLNNGPGDMVPASRVAAERDIPDPHTGDRLYRNDGGRFTDVSAGSGINRSMMGSGLGVVVSDLNGDGLPDMYICNDFFERDHLLLNNGDGTFTDHVLNAMRHISIFSMGVDAADINNDGLPDIMVVDMVAEDNYRRKTNMSGMDPMRFHATVAAGLHHQYMINTLQLNNGRIPTGASPADLSGVVPPIAFSEIARLAGVSHTDWSWAPLFADLDQDGLLDLYVTNGLRKDLGNSDLDREMRHIPYKDDPATLRPAHRAAVLDILSRMTSTPLPNAMYHNQNGLTFTETALEWGLGQAGFSTGAAYADLDGDGDLDLVVNNVDAKPFVYRNNTAESGGGGHLQVAFEGPPGNTHGIGARVGAFGKDGAMWRENFTTRGFQSAVEAVVHFGTGSMELLDSVRVEWPDGLQEVLHAVPTRQRITVRHTDARPAPQVLPPPPTIFQDLTQSTGIGHRHAENPFDDFQRQVLLPQRMSELGPAIAVADVNGDGRDDLFVGGAHGFAGRLYLQKADGTFREVTDMPFGEHAAQEDIDAVFFDADGNGLPDLYVVSGGYESFPESPLLQDRFYRNLGKGRFEHVPEALPTMPSSGGCVAVGDLDGDGHPDLFVGGRQVPGAYPFAPRSHLLRNDGKGHFTDVTEARAPELMQPGMVTAATWTDIDGDGLPELVVVGEWMPVMVMRNRGGMLQGITSGMGLGRSQGWWSSVAAGDLNGDGFPDLVLGNLGLNYSYKATQDEPFVLHGGDMNGDGEVEVVLAYAQKGRYWPWRGRECSGQQMPELLERFPSYELFGQSTFEEVYTPEMLAGSLRLEAREFASCVLLSDVGGAYKLVPLPIEAQFSSVNGISIDDYDGDGLPDVLLAGNLWQSEVETMRNDASIGLLLRGDGKGGLRPVPLAESGFFANGDVKGVAPLRLADGTRCVVLANNSGPLQVIGLRNARRSASR